ncbi:MAG: hypothetical protein HQM09_23765 [Candidatus Riflebacteria bacterium]|nr:hypothetical protein [Candidatus Riflebacteria bacterium]
MFNKRIAMDCAAFSTPGMAVHFETFGQWLGREVGEHKAALTIHRHLAFFMEIERRWKAIPDYNNMLEHFGTQELRRVLLPMRWLEECRLVVPDIRSKEENSERRRIMASLKKLPRGSRGQTILEGYHKALSDNLLSGKTTLRSIRLALFPAVVLLLKAGEMGCMPPDQKAVEAYLEKTPGQRAAVSGFVRYLRYAHRAKITLPQNNPQKAAQRRHKKLEAEMLELMRIGESGDAFLQRWIAVALEYFHGVPRKRGLLVKAQELHAGDNGDVTILIDGARYYLPRPTSGTLTQAHFKPASEARYLPSNLY